ncbi:MAG: DMT family transporter [SAR324 cluster bacterium]|nr:DMT family transporter [SAR324 cluster bacterium]
MTSFSSKEIMGSLVVFASAFCFYLSTVSIRWAKTEVVLHPSFFAFSRVLLGFFFIIGILLIKRQPLYPKRYDLLITRTVTNIIAVFCFFKAVDVTTVAEANILNMTYPLFIAVISWFFFKEQGDWKTYSCALLAFCGILLILAPGEINIAWNNLWGLASGIMASIAIISLNLARQHNNTDTILLFVFGLGSVLLYAVFHQEIHWPDSLELRYLMLCSIFGIAGQYLLTLGFRYVTALEGGIISSARILLAAILGPYLVLDPSLSLYGWAGALLIFGTNIYLTWQKIEAH